MIEGTDKVKNLYDMVSENVQAVLRAAIATVYVTKEHIEDQYNIKQIYDQPLDELIEILTDTNDRVKKYTSFVKEDVYLQAIVNAAKKEQEDFFTCGGAFGFTKVPIP